jgi:CDP-paratose 2-epimerase
MAEIDRVLVTGGAGFIGSHLTSFYADRGTEVVVLDNLSRGEILADDEVGEATSNRNWTFLSNEYPEIELVEADIREQDRLQELVRDVDGVVHTAGQVAVTASVEDPRTDFEVNALGTFNLLEAARKVPDPPGFVFTSTNKVYGDNVNEIPVKEMGDRYEYDDPAFSEGIPESFPIDETAHTPYGCSKLAADLYVQDYALRSEVPAAAFRMGCIYGTRQFGNEDQGWVAHFLLSVLREEPITIFGDGKQVRDLLFVDDLARAFDSFLQDPSGKSPVFNIGGGPERTVSLLELLDVIEEKTGIEPEVSFDDWREKDQRVYFTDVSRAREELSWDPRIDVEEGVERFLDWYARYEEDESITH